MLSPQERDEILAKGREDGARLFKVSEGIYKTLIFINWVVGIVGGLSTIIIGANTNPLLGFAVAIGVALTCVINYSVAVLVTHGAKVLVHLLFANLATMEIAGDLKGGQR